PRTRPRRRPLRRPDLPHHPPRRRGRAHDRSAGQYRRLDRHRAARGERARRLRRAAARRRDHHHRLGGGTADDRSGRHPRRVRGRSDRRCVGEFQMTQRMRMLAPTILVVGLLALAATSSPVQSQTWPQKTVRFIVPLPPGSGMDLSARLLAERLAGRWGQSVVVENRQGADGIPAVVGFFSARGHHTLLFSFAGVGTCNHLRHERLPYDPAELVPIVPVVDNFLGVSVTAMPKVGTLAELVQAAKAQPGKLNWAATPGLPYYILLALQK